jgi:hypothetical protein
MNEELRDLENQHSDDNIAAYLMIECNNDGEISFSCDWSQDENGITCASSILASLDSGGLSQKILQNLKLLHEDSESLDQINKIEVYYNAIKKMTERANNLDDEDVVVNPLDVSSLM